MLKKSITKTVTAGFIWSVAYSYLFAMDNIDQQGRDSELTLESSKILKGVTLTENYLTPCHRITKLTLEQCKIPDVSMLLRFLKENPSLTELTLRSNQFLGTKAYSITKYNTTITHLSLDKNYFADPIFLNVIISIMRNLSHVSFLPNMTGGQKIRPIEIKEIGYLGKQLEQNTTLTYLSLDAVAIDNAFAAYALKGNTALRTLILDKPGIESPYQLETFANYLGANTTLTSLTLIGGKFGGADTIATALTLNSTLTEFHFEGHPEMSAFSLIEAALGSRFLIALSLRNVNITDQKLPAVASKLKTNTSLIKLDLSGNKFTQSEPFQEVLQTNTTLTSLTLPEGVDGSPLEAYLRRNVNRNITSSSILTNPVLTWHDDSGSGEGKNQED